MHNDVGTTDGAQENRRKDSFSMDTHPVIEIHYAASQNLTRNAVTRGQSYGHRERCNNGINWL